VKATQGVRFKDGKFGSYWADLAALEDANKPYRGAYHFLSAKGSAEDQANSYVEYLNLHGGLKAVDLAPCVDLEWDRTSDNPDQWKGQEPDVILAKTLKWLQIVEMRTKRKPIIYTARSWWRERIQDEKKLELLDKYSIWIADYSTSHKATEKPSVINGKRQMLWQFTDDASLSTGYNQGMDANIYYGTVAQFETDFGVSK
jgi:lysozyme